METPSADQNDEGSGADARLTDISAPEAARACLEGLPDVLVLLDEDGVVRYLRGPVEQIVGLDPGAVLGAPGIDLVDPADRRAVRLFFRECLKGAGQVGATSCTARRPDGSRRVLSLRVKAVHFSSGEWGFVCTVRDVTAQHRREEERSRAVQEAKDFAQIQAAFLSNLSHAIRTPLATIVGFAEVLVEELAGEPEEFARLIYRSGRQLSEMLQSAADLARLRMEDGPPNLRHVRLQPAVRAIIRRFQRPARDKGIELYHDLPGDELLVEVDEAKLRGVLNHLISNALKFTEEGWVIVRVYRDGEQACLEVQDTGRGISEAFRPELFRAFRQERTQSGGRGAGAGLGLSICRRLVESMQGGIEVQSQKGRGSTFTVSLPLA